ncbi:MAG: extracellular substrate binding-like orphan protein GrrP [Cyanobacteriota bacterium]|nr:extracellular substrate binding-like orphan protein GrrP [Cyanobacteriota bacterium]
MRVRAALALGAVALLSACSGQPSAESEAPKAPEQSSATGTLKAVIFENDKPLVQANGDSVEGLAIEVLNQIRGEAGLSEVSYTRATSVDEGLESVSSGKADIACGVPFTWERAKTFSYSLPFAIGGTRLLAAAGIDGTPESLEGIKVAVVEDSAAAKVLGNVVPEAELTPFKTPAEALAALNDNTVQALGGGSLWLAANKGDSNTMLVPVRPYGRSGIGCIVKQDNGKLLASANLAIGQMMQAYVDGDAGSREEINRWIGPDSSVKLSEATISGLYSMMLGSTAEISTNVKAPDELVEDIEVDTTSDDKTAN